MDFGPRPDDKIEPKSQLRSKPASKKRPLAVAAMATIVAVAAIGLYLMNVSKNPLPVDIKNQISYKTIYPSKASSVNQSSYSYRAESKVLTFNVRSYGADIVFTEQPAPESIGSDGQTYYPALGIHPYAQFQSKIGPVALAKFYKSSSLKSEGQSAILAAQGTLLVAHSDKDLTNAQWKQLFDSLKISK